MDTLQVIQTRHSIGKVKSGDCAARRDRKIIECSGSSSEFIIKCAPWRFVVLTGQRTQPIGRDHGSIHESQVSSMSEEALAKERHQALAFAGADRRPVWNKP